MLEKTFDASRLSKFIHDDRDLQLILIGEQSSQKCRFAAS
jgi:hypothetical protein